MADFTYPPNGNFSIVATHNQVNVFDFLQLSYDSPWPSLNLTVFCLAGSTSTSWRWWNVTGNPLKGTGTYILPQFNGIKFGIYQYPTHCKFELTKYGDADTVTDGDTFELVSIRSTSALYPPWVATATTTTSGNKTSTNSLTSATDTLGSPSIPYISASTTPTDPSATSPATLDTPTSIASDASTASSGLSVAAEAGIGIGLGVLVLAVAFLAFLVLRQRRKMNRWQGLQSRHSGSEMRDDRFALPPQYPQHELPNNVRTLELDELKRHEKG